MIIQQKLLKIKYMASNVNVAYAWTKSNDLMAFWLQSSSQNIHRKKI